MNRLSAQYMQTHPDAFSGGSPVTASTPAPTPGGSVPDLEKVALVALASPGTITGASRKRKRTGFMPKKHIPLQGDEPPDYEEWMSDDQEARHWSRLVSVMEALYEEEKKVASEKVKRPAQYAVKTHLDRPRLKASRKLIGGHHRHEHDLHPRALRPGTSSQPVDGAKAGSENQGHHGFSLKAKQNSGEPTKGQRAAFQKPLSPTKESTGRSTPPSGRGRPGAPESKPKTPRKEREAPERVADVIVISDSDEGDRMPAKNRRGSAAVGQ